MRRILIRLVQTQEAGCPGHTFSADLEGLVVACHEQPTQPSGALRQQVADIWHWKPHHVQATSLGCSTWHSQSVCRCPQAHLGAGAHLWSRDGRAAGPCTEPRRGEGDSGRTLCKPSLLPCSSPCWDGHPWCICEHGLEEWRIERLHALHCHVGLLLLRSMSVHVPSCRHNS